MNKLNNSNIICNHHWIKYWSRSHDVKRSLRKLSRGGGGHRQKTLHKQRSIKRLSQIMKWDNALEKLEPDRWFIHSGIKAQGGQGRLTHTHRHTQTHTQTHTNTHTDTHTDTHDSLSWRTKPKWCTRQFGVTLVADPNVAISVAVSRRHLLFWLSDTERRSGRDKGLLSPPPPTHTPPMWISSPLGGWPCHTETGERERGREGNSDGGRSYFGYNQTTGCI